MMNNLAKIFSKSERVYLYPFCSSPKQEKTILEVFNSIGCFYHNNDIEANSVTLLLRMPNMIFWNVNFNPF